MLKIALILLFIFRCQVSICQTTIVALLSKEAIYVGADSRLLSPKINSQTGMVDTVISAACKIGSVNNFNYAVAGDFLPISLSIAKKACEAGTSFEHVFTTYANQMLRKLKDSLQVVKTNYKKEFDRIQKEGSITKILFFGFRKNKPQLTMFNFFIKRYTNENLEIGIKTTTPDESNIWIVGNYQHIKLIAFLSTTWSNGPVNGINNLIQTQQKATNLDVGNPIDILEVKPRESKWIQKKSSCE